jgi:bacterioferritin
MISKNHAVMRRHGRKPIIDLNRIRREARINVEQGAQTYTYQANREVILDNLNDALASEIICFLRYKRHYFTAKGIHAETIAEEFNTHAAEELRHADLLAERIVQLGGDPDFNPATLLSRTHADYIECTNLEQMVKENLIAERIAIDFYREMINYIADKDSTTRRLLEKILSQEEQHADELCNWLVTK